MDPSRRISGRGSTTNGKAALYRSVSHTYTQYRPVYNNGESDKVPITKAGIISLITFSWLTPVMMYIHKKGILSVLSLQWWKEDTAEINVNRLEENWNKEKEEFGSEKASLGRAIRKTYQRRIGFSLLSVLFSLSFSFIASACILRLLLDHVSSDDSDVKDGCIIVTSLVVCELCRSLSYSLTWGLNYWNGVRVRSAVMGLFYKKVLKLRSLQDKKIGELVNMCSNDGQRLFEVMANGPFIIGGPIVFVAGSIYIGFLIGIWALIGCATYIVFFILLKFVAGWTERYRSEAIKLTGDRVGLMTEILTCMKLIKMNAWESAFIQRINCKRKKEKEVLEKTLILQSVMTSFVPMMPVLASVFIFLAYILSGNNLTGSQAFTLVSVLYALSFSLALMMHGVRTLSEASVAVNRYKEILLMDEIIQQREITDDKLAIVIEDACLSWDAPQDDYLEECEDSVANAVPVDDVQYINNITTYPEDDDVFLDDVLPTCKLKREESENLDKLSTTLFNIDFTIQKGNLVGICGMKGSGKSSLLAAILGRMEFKSGSISLKGKIAYLSQEPWIINASARENILFGKTYEQERYRRVIEACHLDRDFETFGANDRVEIGERGLNLSGGQKQRICLARALYSDSDIYLLDDPLSALDVIIGKHIFQQCIKKYLKGKTVLFVTHHLEYLVSCDTVMRMQSGRIAEMGTHAELVKAEKEYYELFKLYQTKYEDITRERIKSAIHREEKTSLQRAYSHVHTKKELLRALSHISMKENLPQYSITSPTIADYNFVDMNDLMAAQQYNPSHIPKKLFHRYIKAAGGYIVVIFVFIGFVISIGLQTGANWWLAYWLSQTDQNGTMSSDNDSVIYRNIADRPDVHINALVYGLFVVFMIIAIVLRGLFFVKLLLKAACKLHKKVLEQTMKCPMKFFDTTPIGIILNRFSADMDELDVRLPTNCEMFLQNVFLVLFALAMICYVFPWDLLAVVPLTIVFIILAYIFAPTLQKLKYVDNITRAPFLSHLATTIEGISTIHILGQAGRFSKEFCDMLDRNAVPFFLFYAANRWLALFLDLMTIVVIGVTGYLVVLTKQADNSAQAGLALSFAVQITSILQYTLRLGIETGSRFSSVKRIQDYIENLHTEGAVASEGCNVADDWPKEGGIVFNKYKMRYNEGLPLSLKGITLTIKPQEKVGVVGASGSGKSSLGVALFRLSEAASGAIYIDGKNIRDIQLSLLRSRLSILVQDPVLFGGTLRYNLDPTCQYHSDEELWKALEKCHMKDRIADLDKQLDMVVDESGRNFSMGERQLLCLARTLLRHSKILILDEATASVDTRTEHLVQQTIRDVFKQCTVLIIAHRLNTVINCDRIIVIDNGKVVEFDSPSALLNKSSSKLKLMFDAMKSQPRESATDETVTGDTTNS